MFLLNEQLFTLNCVFFLFYGQDINQQLNQLQTKTSTEIDV